MMEPFDNPTTSPSSPEVRIRALLREYRSEAFSFVELVMLDAFHAIGEELLSSEIDYTRHAISGLSPSTLQLIKKHSGDQDFDTWLNSCPPGEKARCLQDFLNTGKMQMDALRSRFPRAFQKWSEEEDKTLLEEYRKQLESGHPTSWGGLSDRLGRNPNALKIRLERLGEVLPPEEAGRPGRFSR